MCARERPRLRLSSALRICLEWSRGPHLWGITEIGIKRCSLHIQERPKEAEGWGQPAVISKTTNRGRPRSELSNKRMPDSGSQGISINVHSRLKTNALESTLKALGSFL